jgi:hypothetical protein
MMEMEQKRKINANRKSFIKTVVYGKIVKSPPKSCRREDLATH